MIHYQLTFFQVGCEDLNINLPSNIIQLAESTPHRGGGFR